MAKVMDITGKLKNEPKFLKIEDKTFKIDDRKNTVMQTMALFETENSESEIMDETIELLLGKDAAKELNGMELTFENYKTIFIAVMASISGETFEEAEARFQNK